MKPNPLTTGIEELDSLLRGGLHLPNPQAIWGKPKKNGLVVLIRGKAGTGKSTLALQIITALAMEDMREACNRCIQEDGLISMPALKKAATTISERHLFFTIEQHKAELTGVWQRLMQGFLRRRIRILKRSGQAEVMERLPKIGFTVDWEKRFKGKSYLLHLLLCQLYGVRDAELGQIKSLWCDQTYKGKRWPTTEHDNDDEGGLIERPVNKRIIEREKRALSKVLEKSTANFIPIRFGDRFVNDGETRENSFVSWPSIESVSDMIGLISGSGAASQQLRKKVIVCDGMSVLAPDERSLMDFRNLVQRLREHSRLAILVYEPVGKQDEHLDHLCDMVIELSGRQIRAEREEDYFIHQLIIQKARYQETAYGWHLYKLRSWGLEVFPSIHFQVHQPNMLEDQFLDSFTRRKLRKPNSSTAHKEPEKPDTETREFAGSYLELMLGGIVPGSTTVVLGPRGTFKTTLSQDFLLAGRCALDQRSLVISMIDDSRTLRSASGLSCPNVKAKCEFQKDCPIEECKKHGFSDSVFLFYQRPGCVQPSEFLQMLQRRLSFSANVGKPIQRVTFWDLTQIDHRFPMLSAEPMFLPAMVTLFKDYGRMSDKRVSLVIIGASNAKNAAAASVMADNVVFLRRASCKVDYKRYKKDTKVLLAYVDRVQGHLGNEGKALYCLPLGKDPAASADLTQDCMKPIKYYGDERLVVINNAGKKLLHAKLHARKPYPQLSRELSAFHTDYTLAPDEYPNYTLGSDEFEVPAWIETIIKLQEVGGR